MNTEARAGNVSEILRGQIDAMVLYLSGEGRPIPPSALANRGSEDIVALGAVHQQLARLVEPARPETLLLYRELDSAEGTKPLFGIRRAVPLVRGFIYLALLSLVLLMMLGSSRIMTLETEPGEPIVWWHEFLRFFYLCLAASLGAAFHALFNLSRFIINATYDPSHNLSHVVRYVLGLVAGVMLAVVIWPNIESFEGMRQENIGLAVLAMIGGFSATLVHRILHRLVTAVGSIMDGDPKSIEERAKREQRERMRLDDIALLHEQPKPQSGDATNDPEGSKVTQLPEATGRAGRSEVTALG